MVRLGGALSAAAFTLSAMALMRFAYTFPDRLDDAQLETGGLLAVRRRPERSKTPPAEGPDPDSMLRELRALERGLDRGTVVAVALVALVGLRLIFPAAFPWAIAWVIGVSMSVTWILLRAQQLQPEGHRAIWLHGGVRLAILAWLVVGTVPFAAGPLIGGWGWSAYMAALFGIGPFLSLLILLGACAVAVLYHGDVDPSVTVRRATITAALAFAVLFGFGAIETVLSDFVFSLLGLPDGAGAMVAGGTMAVLFKPLHDFIDRRLADSTRTHIGDASEHPAI